MERSTKSSSSLSVSKSRSSSTRASRREGYKFPTRLPRAAAWGWHHYPFCIKVLILAALCTMISLSTPFWVYVDTYARDSSTFGLFTYCARDECTSIHDNLLPEKDVPVWFLFIQGTYFIGVATNLFSLTILTSNLDGTKLTMSVTVHRFACCFIAISVFQQFVALHTFVSYIDAMDFLFIPGDEADFYGSFYVAIVGLALTMATGLMVWIDEDLIKGTKKIDDFNSPNYLLDQVYAYQYAYPYGYSNLEPNQLYKVHTK